MGDPLRIVLADDHAVLRHGLRLLLQSQDDMNVLAEASTGAEALGLVAKMKPDILVVDLTMPELSGVEAIRRVREVSPGTRCVVLTMHDDIAYLNLAREAGGVGYVVKRAAHTELLLAIREVWAGRSFVSDAVGHPVVLEKPKSTSMENAAPLSRREREVLREVAHGYTTKQVAERLNIKVRTVNTYRIRISSKLGVKHRADLVRCAMELGLLDES